MTAISLAPQHPEGLRKNNLLHLQDVYKSYGPKVVLDNIDLSVAAGELCTVVGPSGCGKSTLLRLIVGQEQATSGSVLLEGKPIGEPDTQRGIVYQKYALFPHLSVLDNVALGKSIAQGLLSFGLKKAARDEALHFLERVHLAEHAHKYPHELSGGMQQRVAIAQALIMRPRIVLMDEPFGALDPGTREAMQVFLLELWQQMQMTVFFVTHDLEEAVYLATRVLVVSQYYSDDRGDGPSVNRGAKIVADYALECAALSTKVKETPEFNELITRIRHCGFNPKHRQHVRDFDLQHSDSFRTLTPEEFKDSKR